LGLNLGAVLRIHIGFNADPDTDLDPAFFVNADPDPADQNECGIRADPDPDPDPDPQHCLGGVVLYHK
jgi:hypothetical protein